MLNQEKAKSFIADKHIAVIGVSSKSKGFGVAIFKHLLYRHFNVSAVNPNGGTINGRTIYKSLTEISSIVDTIITVVPPSETEKVVKEAHELGIQKVWMQSGSVSDAAVKFCEQKGMDVIHNQCIIMFTEPIGFIHKFHKWIWKTTGQISK